MISEAMKENVRKSSVIRQMFEEGNRLSQLYGAENVFDFSLGNPNVAAPDSINDTIIDIVKKTETTKLHGYMNNAGFPECRNTLPFFEKTGVSCPKCGKDIVMKMTKKGRRYYGCIGYPDCDFMTWNAPSKEACPKCGGLMVKKGSRLMCINEDCKTVIEKKEE